MEQDGTGAHKARLEGCEEGHFPTPGPQLDRKITKSFHLGMAGQIPGRLPDGVHAPGNNSIIHDNDSTNREIAPGSRLFGKLHCLQEKGAVLG